MRNYRLQTRFPKLHDVRRWTIARCVANYHQALVYYDDLPRSHQVAIDVAVQREIERIDEERARRARYRADSHPRMGVISA